MPMERMTRDSSRRLTAPARLQIPPLLQDKVYTIHYKTANTYSKIKVINVTPKTVTIDANNRMAGENLTFTIKLDNLTKKQ